MADGPRMTTAGRAIVAVRSVPRLLGSQRSPTPMQASAGVGFEAAVAKVEGGALTHCSSFRGSALLTKSLKP